MSNGPFLLATLACLCLTLSACSGLPDTSARAMSHVKTDSHGGALSEMARRFTSSHTGASGVHALAQGPDALAARLAATDAATGSLDVQYYIWHSDDSGVLLIHRLLKAADRGVHIRLLLDDLGTRAEDEGLLVLDSHPNIEVRLFNPVTSRSARMLSALLDFQHANRRMHNKSFIADKKVAIVGGRNIGNEYFGAREDVNFADLDVATVGPVVREVSRQFDDYWNSPSTIEITAIASTRESSEQAAARLARYAAKLVQANRSPAAERVQKSTVISGLREGSISFMPGRAWAVYDDPVKVSSSASDSTTHLAPKLRAVVDSTHKELFIVSPYFIPEVKGVELFRELRARGVRVVVLTNSLGSTDVAAVHAGYKRYRKSLLQCGVELYELKPQPGQAKASGGSSPFGSSSKASLHAKTFTFDQDTIFVGSMNLDPRSLRLNTEVGLLIDCPELASGLTRKVLQNIDRHAYKVQLDGRSLVWLAIEDGKEVRYTKEPATSAWQRMKVALLGCLPIEGQL